MTIRRANAQRLLSKLRDDLGATITDDQIRGQAEQATDSARRLVGSPRKVQILRDPVGTGKTAVALTAAKLLFDEKHIQYLLVIAPNDTVAKQWRERAAPFFNGVLEDVQRARWRRGRVIIGTHRVHPHQKSPNPKQTLVIVDEAHRGLQNTATNAFGAASESAKGAMVLLVTATPYQMTASGLTNMLTVAGGAGGEETDALHDYGKAMADLLHAWNPTVGESSVARLVPSVQEHRDRAQQALDTHLLLPTAVSTPRPPRLAFTSVPLGSWATAYSVARILPELMGRGKSDAFQRGLASSCETVWDSDRAVGNHLTSLRKGLKTDQRRFLDDLEERMGEGTDHPKVAATVNWTIDQVEQGHHVVIFTHWLTTQNAIGKALESALEGKADVAAPQTGPINRRLEKRFKQPPNGEPVVLVLSDRFSESIDLDGGLPSLAHHDLTWNPVRLTQRWGRVVRIRTGFQPIPKNRIFVPLLDVEVERRLARTVAGRQDLVGAMIPHPDATDDNGWTLPDEILRKVSLNFNRPTGSR
ncbi:MAG: DEAD/DEAH box helicase family protein [Microthrixaceae bacterium]|nr:DEAD/DEAH box helicase family protein [Acidimicrobiales bacterium]MCB9404406.1 DEAD/DEAH box helicase family protein [Microthrixaceae bacterium]